MRNYPMGNMTDRCQKYTPEECDGQKCLSKCFVRPEGMKPHPTNRFTPIPRKHKSKLHKKGEKLEKEFEACQATTVKCGGGLLTTKAQQTVRMARLLKAGMSVEKKIKFLQGKEDDGKSNKDSQVPQMQG